MTTNWLFSRNKTIRFDESFLWKNNQLHKEIDVFLFEAYETQRFDGHKKKLRKKNSGWGGKKWRTKILAEEEKIVFERLSLRQKDDERSIWRRKKMRLKKFNAKKNLVRKNRVEKKNLVKKKKNSPQNFFLSIQKLSFTEEKWRRKKKHDRPTQENRLKWLHSNVEIKFSFPHF